MKTTLKPSFEQSTMFNISWLKKGMFILACSLALGLTAYTLSGVYQAQKINKQTHGLLKQTALHLSKMQMGQSVGGFPPFEPPEGDNDYRNKIEKEEYTPRDVNDWVKEINNFLSQIIKKNPNKSLRQILQKAGLKSHEVDNFIGSLREVYRIAQSQRLNGVTEKTITIFRDLLLKLEVLP